MTNRFVCSSTTTQRTIRFKVQIEDYSKYACKGYYTSPEFGNNDNENKWNLLIHVYDGADHENFIDVWLQRHDYVTEMQLLSVKTSIINCFGYNVLKNETEILFGVLNEAQILAVAKKKLKGLKKNFYLPKDTLTLQCELSIHESSEKAYENEESFLNNISRYESDISEYFAQSRLVKKAEDYFVRRITNFSVQSCVGSTITPEFRSEILGGSWCFVICKSSDYNNSSKYLDIRLMRRESLENQLVKVRLSITDPLNNELLSKEKFVYLTSSREVQLLPSTETVISSWCGLRKKQLIPDDTLTLHCKMVLYEQIDDTFNTKEDFDIGVETSGYAPMQLLQYLAVICFMLPDILPIFYCTCLAILSLLLQYLAAICFMLPDILRIFYCTCLAILSFMWYTIEDTFIKITAFVIVVIVVFCCYFFIKFIYTPLKKMFQYFKDIERREKWKFREEKKKMTLGKWLEYGFGSVKNIFYMIYFSIKFVIKFFLKFVQNPRKPNYSNRKNNELYYNRKLNYSSRKNNQSYYTRKSNNSILKYSDYVLYFFIFVIFYVLLKNEELSSSKNEELSSS